MRTRKMTDKMLLEGLVNKYGKNELVKAVNEMTNEPNCDCETVGELLDFLNKNIKSGNISYDTRLGSNRSGGPFVAGSFVELRKVYDYRSDDLKYETFVSIY